MLSSKEAVLHLAEMANKGRIGVHPLPPMLTLESGANWTQRQVQIALPVGSQIRIEMNYASALHEIGHLMTLPRTYLGMIWKFGPRFLVRHFIMGRITLSRELQKSELEAWVWAREHAIVWTPTMQRTMEESLRTYKISLPRREHANTQKGEGQKEGKDG